MIVSLSKLRGGSDDFIDFDYNIDLTDEEVNFYHPFKEPVRICGSITDKSEVIRLAGTIETTVHAQCARCNAAVNYEKAVDISFSLAYSVQNEDSNDIYIIESEDIELDDIFVPELLMDMEMAVYCAEDCKGLCPKCGKNLNDGDCGCVHKEIDPRLYKLAQWLEDNK